MLESRVFGDRQDHRTQLFAMRSPLSLLLPYERFWPRHGR
jgi:hypothetical protein